MDALTSIPQSDETQLVASLRRGDPRAFDELYARYHTRLYGFLTRLGGRRELAEDLHQSLWERVARHAASLREETDLAAWLFTLARNLWRSHQRFAIIDRLRKPETPEEQVGDDSTVRALEAREQVRHLEQALSRCSANHREILLLVGAEGLAPVQAATILGLSAEAARQRLQRARAQLRDEMARLAGQGGGKGHGRRA